MNSSIARISYRPIKTVKELKENLDKVNDNVSLEELFQDYILVRRTENKKIDKTVVGQLISFIG